ncbi:hypothetical protein CPB84DRAFT_1673220 [Gymnopilus junonius]|uniref:Uncharacterized protein n=1 Tax=Gymnopilus junonius TaxID=109634 RepID=A0A9P5NZ44_GYMJU|nr:hypothetical protein CPB84DRAFT_1673220 [Gymnopilus junonius]
MLKPKQGIEQNERPILTRYALRIHRRKTPSFSDPFSKLEQTVTKLQVAVGFTNEQIAALPPPLLKIRELEQDNSRLQKENEELRRLLTDPNSRTLSSDATRRSGSIGTYPDARACDRDYSLKRRKSDGIYISPGNTPPHGHESSRPPPPLTIPQPMSHHYGNMNSSPNGHGNQGGSLFNLHAPAFQMPNTPSGSSATSSPPFSASIFPS